jgi:uncharacterized membrane-anchored protein YhcB (DUF1043 family)
MEAIGMNGLMVGAILVAGVALGFLLGRRTSAARARAKELEANLEELWQEHETAQAAIQTGKDELERARTEIQTGKDELETARAEIQTGQEELQRAHAEIRTGQHELERAQAEIQTGKEELERTREGHELYRGKVADHFVGTSERLRELTFQYRAIYNHLAEGAGELCPEGFEKLEGGLGLDALPEESETPEPDSH